MRTWYTGKPREPTKRSHINFCVFDRRWEATESFEFDRNPNVEAWVKNDHPGFEILYIFRGIVQKYHPDFIIRLRNGNYLVLETKGQDTQQDKTKREFLDKWVGAVNKHAGFVTWQHTELFRRGSRFGAVERHYRVYCQIHRCDILLIEASKNLNLGSASGCVVMPTVTHVLMRHTVNNHPLHGK